MAASSRTFTVRSARLLRDEKLASIILRLMMSMNDIAITNSSMAEWEKTKDSNKAEDLKKKARWRRGVLYFGRVQSAHLFEAFGIIAEIKKDSDLSAVVAAVDRKTQNSFDTVANFLNDPDYKMLAKMRNVIAFHYDTKLTLKRLKRLADQSPSHLTNYSLGGRH